MAKKFKLPKAVKSKWIKALTSGEYKQGRGSLMPSQDTYCCLGVACKIGVLTPQVSLETSRSTDCNILTGEVESKLMHFNDNKHYNFKWIAAYIKRYL